MGKKVGVSKMALAMVPSFCRWVLVSTSLPSCRSTMIPKWCRKSAPRMGFWTSAITKIHRKVLLSPRLRVQDFVPKVGMGVPLAALRLRWSVDSCLWGGMTLTAAPVSTK